EDYFVKEVVVKELPSHLHRGESLVEPDGSMHDARLKREDKSDSKGGIWKWKDDPFEDTREFNGLRVLMALINNWDLKDVNNTVYEDRSTGEQIYLVHDLGATFGTNAVIAHLKKARGNLRNYRRSKFITKSDADEVSFATPGRPVFLALGNPKQYFMRV